MIYLLATSLREKSGAHKRELSSVIRLQSINSLLIKTASQRKNDSVFHSLVFTFPEKQEFE